MLSNQIRKLYQPTTKIAFNRLACYSTSNSSVGNTQTPKPKIVAQGVVGAPSSSTATAKVNAKDVTPKQQPLPTTNNNNNNGNNNSNNNRNTNAGSTAFQTFKRYLLIATLGSTVAGGAYLYYQYLGNENFMFSSKLGVDKDTFDKYNRLIESLYVKKEEEHRPADDGATEPNLKERIQDHLVQPSVTVTTTPTRSEAELIHQDEQTPKIRLTAHSAPSTSEDAAEAAAIVEAVATDAPAVSASTSADIIENMTELVYEFEDEIYKKLGSVESAIEESLAHMKDNSNQIEIIPIGEEMTVLEVEPEVLAPTPEEVHEEAAIITEVVPVAVEEVVAEVIDPMDKALKIMEEQYIHQIRALLEENIKLKEQIELIKEMVQSYLDTEEGKLKQLYQEKTEDNIKLVTDEALKKLEEMETHYKLSLEQNYNTLATSVQKQRENLTAIYNAQQKEIENGEIEKRIISTMTIALVDLKKAMNKAVKTPFLQQYQKLKDISRYDQLLQTLIANLPDGIETRGVSSMPKLREQFYKLAEKAREASLLPDDRSLFGRALSKVASKLIVPEKGMVEGGDTDSTLARAEEFLIQGNLSSAIKEVESISSNNKEITQITKQWIQTAKERVLMDNLVQLLESKLNQITSSIKNEK